MMTKIIAFLTIVLIVVSCEESANEKDWGFSLLYMPQAVIQSGGVNNNYFVQIDSSSNADTSIIVGLYRSGLEPIKSVSVDLTIDIDSLNAAISDGLITNAVLMDPSYYEIPQSLSLTDGNRSNFDNIIIHKQLLWADSEPDDRQFILPVRISKPTLYELNNELSFCMFIFTRNK